MSAPIHLVQRGSRWEVYVDVAAAKRRSLRRIPRLDGYPPDAVVPVVKTGAKTLDLQIDGKPARLTKGQADNIAFSIGNYVLGLGSFVHAYVEEVREPKAARDRDRKVRPLKRLSQLEAADLFGVAHGESPPPQRIDKLMRRGLLETQGARLIVTTEGRAAFRRWAGDDLP